MLSPQLKHFFSSTLKFVACSIAIYLAVLVLLCTLQLNGKPLVFRVCQGLVWKGGYTYERFQEFNPQHKYDILIFGSSRANRGLNPRIFDSFGYNAYNLGTDDQTPLNTEVLVKGYVKQNNCRLVIIDVYDKVFTQPDLESTSDLIQNVRENKTAFKMAWSSKDVRAINFFCVRMVMSNTPPDYKAETDLYKGFRALKDDSILYAAKVIPYKSDSKNIHSLQRTLSYLKSINVPFLLVSQPMIFASHKYNHNIFVNDLAPVLKENQTTFYDFTNDNAIVTKTDYVDPCHLNANGANKYSAFLLKNVVAPKMKTLNATTVNQKL